MTDLSTLLAEARRIAEEVRDLANACADNANSEMGQMRAELNYTDYIAEHAPRLAAALLALIPVVEAVQESGEELKRCRDHLWAFSNLYPEDATAETAAILACAEAASDRVSSATRDLFVTLTEALKP